MARIIFLGTAGNTAVVGKNLRASGGIVVQLGDLQFHLDPGPGALSQAGKYGVNLRNTTAILVSHKHLNHCNDLNVLIDTLTYSGMERRGVLVAAKSVVQPSDGERPILLQHFQKMLEKIIVLEKGSKVGVDLIEIHALSAQHSDPSAVGFKLFCPKFVMSYVGDTTLHDGLVEELAGTDLLVLNVPYPGKTGRGLNLDTDAALELIMKVRPKIAVLTHFGVEMLKADPLQEARRIQKITGVQTIAAKDGLVLAPASFSTPKSPVKGYY